MTTKTPQPDTKRKRGRQYVPRPCVVCEGEATLTVQVRTRPLGPGTHLSRHTTYSGSLLLCDRCSRSRGYAAELVDAAAELLQERPRRTLPRGPGLFAVAEVGMQ